MPTGSSQKLEKLMGPGGIGQDEGGDGDRQEDCAARSLDAQKRRKRLRQPVDEFARQPIEPGINLSILIMPTSSDASIDQ